MSAITATVSSTASKTKVPKTKSFVLDAPVSLSGAPINMSTKKVSTGVTKVKDQDLIAIDGIEAEIKWINSHLESGADFSTVDSDLTNRLVKDSVAALIQKHTDLGDEALKGKKNSKKFNLAQKVFTGSAEWNRALLGLAKFDADQTHLLNAIPQEDIDAFAADNEDIVSQLPDVSKSDLYIKSKMLETMAFFIKNPISKTIEHCENGTEALMAAFPDYVPLVKKDTPVDADFDFVASSNQIDKNYHGLNIEYCLAYITLAQMISSFDEYTVKRLAKEAKAYFDNFAETKVKALGEDVKALKKLVTKIGTDDEEALKTTIRLYTVMVDKTSLAALASKDKKLDEKLKSADSKWPKALDLSTFAREYTSWMLKDDAKYQALLAEHQAAIQMRALSKKFMIDGSASDITKRDGSVDKIIYILQGKLQEYQATLGAKLAAVATPTSGSTFCGRTVTVSKKKAARVNALTDVQLLLCVKSIEESAEESTEESAVEEPVEEPSKVIPPKALDDEDSDSEDEEDAPSEVTKGGSVVSKKETKVKEIASYGTYMRKLYKNAIKSFKFTFAVSDEHFVSLFQHITRDAVNMYTCLGVRACNNFSNVEIYTNDYNPLTTCYKDVAPEELDTFIKKLAHHVANRESANVEDLPDTLPVIVDLFDAFNEDMEVTSVMTPGSNVNLRAPLSAKNIDEYRADVAEHYRLVSERYDAEESDEESEPESDDEDETSGSGSSTASKKKAKRRTLPNFEKTFRTYYKSTTPKCKSKNTTLFLSDLAMLVTYIVQMRLVWLGSLITYSSEDPESPYFTASERKDYVVDVIVEQIESTHSANDANAVFKTCVTAPLKEVKNRFASNKADNEELIHKDVEKLRKYGKAELDATETALANARAKKSTNVRTASGITNSERKLLSSHTFMANFILDKMKTVSLKSESEQFVQRKIERIYSFAEDLAKESKERLDIRFEQNTGLIWSWPIMPYTNANSIGIVGASLQRSLLRVIEDSLTTQFHSINPKKNVIHGETFGSVLNIVGGNTVW